MSDYKTLDIVCAMADHLEARAWDTVSPKLVFRSPVPPGNLTFPCMAVYSVGGVEEDASGYNMTGVRETFQWTLAESLGLGDLSVQYQKHLQWRDESRLVARRAIDQYWGMGGIVTMTFINPVWESDFFQLGDEGEPMTHLVATTLRMEVDYREEF